MISEYHFNLEDGGSYLLWFVSAVKTSISKQKSAVIVNKYNQPEL